MTTKFLSTVIFLFVCFNVKGQSVEEYKKAHAAVMAEIRDIKLKTFINGFSSALVNYNWEATRKFFDKDHYSGQMKLYLNDDFMFGHLGKVGKRDTAKVHQFYLRETLGLTREEQEKRILTPEITNLFELEDFSSINQLYFIKKEVPDVSLFYYDLTIIAITEDGRTYLGKCWIGPTQMKIFGSVG